MSTPIREAREADAHDVAALWTEAYVTLGVGGRADPYSEADFATSARHGDIYVAEPGGAIAGVVVLFGPEAPGRNRSSATAVALGGA